MMHLSCKTFTKPLFTFCHEAVFQRETYRRFVALLDNYHQRDGVAEFETQEDRDEPPELILLAGRCKSRILILPPISRR